MKRSDAGMRAKRCQYLTIVEKAVFLALLERSDNADCAVPIRMTPTVAELAGWVSLRPRAVQYALAHLETHGWLERQWPTDEHGNERRGRGYKPLHRLVPRDPDQDCTCQRRVHARAPIRSEKGARGCTRRVHAVNEFPQVNDQIAHRALRGEQVGMAENNTETTATNVVTDARPKCVNPDCDKPARRACRTCWECAPRWEHESATPATPATPATDPGDPMDWFGPPRDPQEVAAEALVERRGLPPEVAAEMVADVYRHAKRLLTPSDAARRVEKKIGPRVCVMCGDPLDIKLALAGEDTHPACQETAA